MGFPLSGGVSHAGLTADCSNDIEAMNWDVVRDSQAAVPSCALCVSGSTDLPKTLNPKSRARATGFVGNRVRQRKRFACPGSLHHFRVPGLWFDWFAFPGLEEIPGCEACSTGLGSWAGRARRIFPSMGQTPRNASRRAMHDVAQSLTRWCLISLRV